MHVLHPFFCKFVSSTSSKFYGSFFLSMGGSGHFVLARWTNEDKTEIEMTAFKVSVMTMILLNNGLLGDHNGSSSKKQNCKANVDLEK